MTWRETWEMLGWLAQISALMLICLSAPLATAKVFGPWLGVLVAAVAFRVWGRIGPPPMPGF